MTTKGGLPEGNYTEIDGGHRMHWLEAGEGERTLVFLHGSGPGASGHSNFKGNYPWFAERGFRVIVPDQIGYGFSDKPREVEYHIDFFVTALMQTLDAAGVDKFTPIGNSLGGAVALRMALDHPERIEALILMAPGGIEEQEAYFTMPGMQAMREFFTSGIDPQELEEKDMAAMLEHLVHDPSHVTPELAAERLHVYRTQHPGVVGTMKVPNITARLGEIKCPVLGFWGANEGFMPLSGIETLAKGCSEARVIVQSGCGHWFMVEHVELFNRSCLDFLREG